MLRVHFYLGLALVALSATAGAATIRFDTDPFAGTTARTTPGRQIVAGESFINFSIAQDIYSVDPAAFGVTGPVNFVNSLVGNLPSTGVNVVVLESFE